jgi:hypothetical protein
MGQKENIKDKQPKLEAIDMFLFVGGFIELAVGLGILICCLFTILFPYIPPQVELDIVIGLICFHGGIFLVSLFFIFEKLKSKGM